jgi:hypothetical protein
MTRVAERALAAVVIGCCATAASATDTDIRVSPMHAQGSQAKYPRLVVFPDAGIRKKVNDLLAERENEWQQSKTACHNSFRDTHQKTGKAEINLAVDVTYLSKRYVSMDVRQSEYCGGQDRSENLPNPLTIDLAKGAAADWKVVFKPGALPDPQGSVNVEPPLLSIYRAHYGAAKKPATCPTYLKPTIAVKLWLDAKKGVVVSPSLPPAAQICVTDIALTPNELGPVIADQNFLADVKATVTPAAPSKGGRK